MNETYIEKEFGEEVIPNDKRWQYQFQELTTPQSNPVYGKHPLIPTITTMKNKCGFFSPHKWEEIKGSPDRFHQLWECTKCGEREMKATIGNTHGLGI